MRRGLADLYAEVNALAKLVGVTDYLRPADCDSEDRVWLEMDSAGEFCMRYMERGKVSVLARGGYDAVLFEAMRSLAQDLAVSLELKERGSGPYSRRKWFDIQRELMTRMRPDFAVLIANHQAGVLAEHPFRDDQ